MSRIANGFEFLEQLKKENGKQLQNYKDFSRYLDDKARNKGVPIHGQFELTPLCNFSCKMCYVHLDKDQLGEDAVLSVETWKNLIYQAWNAGMIHVTLTGGECLVYPGFDELYLYLHDLGCKIIVLTRVCFKNHNHAKSMKTKRKKVLGCRTYTRGEINGIKGSTVRDN